MARYASKISESFVQGYKDKIVPWGDVGYVTYKRTYARLKGHGQTEEWWETIERCCNGIFEIGGIFTQEEIQTLYDHVFHLRCSFSGRALWQLGTDTVRDIGADSLQNCWHVACNDLEAFPFTMDELMLGGGVGFNVQPEYVYELPIVKYNPPITRVDEHDVDYIVPDNREGWVELLRRVLKCFFETGKKLEYSTVCIRSKGELISSFGGTASGPGELCKGIGEISQIIGQRIGEKLRPIDCLDIMNIIGKIVVAGNVRRSAEIAIGDINDMDFLEAKDWNRYTIPNWRSMSNNTVASSEFPTSVDFWSTYVGEGEPYGLFNPHMCRHYGRLVDGFDYRPDLKVVGPNPCAEITLESFEPCNLGEQFAPNIRNVAEFAEIAELMYKTQKTISCVPFQNPRTNEVVQRNHRLGLGITGFLQAPHMMNPEWMNEVYHHLEQSDKYYSRQLGVDRSIKLTTVKPSGTLSLLAGVTPGVHPAYAEYYIRRIRFAAEDPLVKISRDHGYHVEPVRNFDGSNDMGTMIVSFPIHTPDDTVVADEVTAIQQLEYQK